MKKYNLNIPIIIVILLFKLILFSNLVFAGGYTVQGSILKAPKNTPIPGLTVSLVHRVLGRSASAISNQLGQYIF